MSERSGCGPGNCHARACPGHPRLCGKALSKTWMAGTSPAMTKNKRRHRCADPTHLHRLDLDLAEFHHALAVLQGDAALGVLAVGCPDDGLDAVERHVEARALGGDLEHAPLAAGL